MNKEDKKQMTEIVGKALEDVVLPQLFEIKKDVKILKGDMEEVKSDLKEHNQRLEKVEFNTRVSPYDKEHVDKKFANHELRIGKLELKKLET